MSFAYNHLHILGASGSGTTTLASSLSKELQYTHFDSDDYFWKTKFTEPRPRDERLQKLSEDLSVHNRWILSGAVIDWWNPLIPLFDLVIFISVNNDLRMQRLKVREKKRYGSEIDPEGKKHKEHLEFLEWANLYETGGMEVRSRMQQKEWLKNLSCKVLELDGADSIENLTSIVLETTL